MTTAAKICGIRTEAALRAAAEAGADYVGFVLYPRSPRAVTVDEAQTLARLARQLAVRSVVLLVDPDDPLVEACRTLVAPDMIQLHGAESIARVAAVRTLSGLPIVKAVSVSSASEVSDAAAYHRPGAVADVILFDAKPRSDPASLPGGNGLSFDWRLLAERPEFPFWLAGGLTPDNVAAAIRLTAPAAVDVSSGVESSPGVKDPALIRRFLAAVKAAKQDVPAPRRPQSARPRS